MSGVSLKKDLTLTMTIDLLRSHLCQVLNQRLCLTLSLLLFILVHKIFLACP